MLPTGLAQPPASPLSPASSGSRRKVLSCCKLKLGHAQGFFWTSLSSLLGHSGDTWGRNPDVCSALFGTGSAASGGHIKGWGGNEPIPAPQRTWQPCRCCGARGSSSATLPGLAQALRTLSQSAPPREEPAWSHHCRACPGIPNPVL